MIILNNRIFFTIYSGVIQEWKIGPVGLLQGPSMDVGMTLNTNAMMCVFSHHINYYIPVRGGVQQDILFYYEH